jgi:signal peptidase II
LSRLHETRRASPLAAARARITRRASPSAGARALILLPPALAACGLVVAIDQGSKALINSQLARGERAEVLPFLAFQNTRNRGVAFGLAGDVSAALIGGAVAALVLFLLYLALREGGSRMIWLPAALLVGGALGNLADRVRQGGVTDFIDLPAWPTFNLADVAIVAGVLLLMFYAGRGVRDDPPARPGAR